MQLLRLAGEPIRGDQERSAPRLPEGTEGMSGVVRVVTSQAGCPYWAITDIWGRARLWIPVAGRMRDVGMLVPGVERRDGDCGVYVAAGKTAGTLRTVPNWPAGGSRQDARRRATSQRHSRKIISHTVLRQE